MTSDICAVCGRPSRYLFAFPSGEASAGVVYDGAPVCSPECAQALRMQRERERRRMAGELAGEEGASAHDEALETSECGYCGAPIAPDRRAYVPAAWDSEAWGELAQEHNPDCEWIETRAHRMPAPEWIAGEEGER